MNNNRRKNISKYLLFVVIASLTIATSACVNYFDKPALTQKTLEYSQFMQELKQGKIERVGLSVDRRNALVHAKDGTKSIVKLPLNDDRLIEILVANVKGDIYVLPK